MQLPGAMVMSGSELPSEVLSGFCSPVFVVCDVTRNHVGACDLCAF